MLYYFHQKILKEKKVIFKERNPTFFPSPMNFFFPWHHKKVSMFGCFMHESLDHVYVKKHNPVSRILLKLCGCTYLKIKGILLWCIYKNIWKQSTLPQRKIPLTHVACIAWLVSRVRYIANVRRLRTSHILIMFKYFMMLKLILL